MRRLGIAIVLAGCGGGGTQSADLATSSAGGYVVASTLQANTAQATSVLFTAASLSAGATIDESNAISIPDTVSLFGLDGAGQVYATTANTPTITRYEVDAAGTLTPGPVVSVAQYGVSTGFSTRSIAFVSATKAYLFDDTTLQAIVFDPTAMTTTKSIDLGAMKKTGYHVNFAYDIPVRGTQIVVTGFYYDASFAHTIPETAVALIDSTTDAVTIVHDTRCGSFSTVAQTASGDLYFGSDTYAVALNLVGGTSSAPPGCVLRMKAGQDAFDPDFMLAVTDATSGQPGGGVVAGQGESVWIRAFDKSLFSIGATSSGTDVLAAAAWRWWKLDPSTSKAVVATYPPGGGEVHPFHVGGHAIADDAAADYSHATLLDFSVGTEPVAGAVVAGLPSGVIKAR